MIGDRRLDRCPFCGSHVVHLAAYYARAYSDLGVDCDASQSSPCYGVECGNPDCNAVIFPIYKDEEEAIAAWNRRI